MHMHTHVLLTIPGLLAVTLELALLVDNILSTVSCIQVGYI